MKETHNNSYECLMILEGDTLYHTNLRVIYSFIPQGCYEQGGIR